MFSTYMFNEFATVKQANLLAFKLCGQNINLYHAVILDKSLTKLPKTITYMNGCIHLSTNREDTMSHSPWPPSCTCA